MTTLSFQYPFRNNHIEGDGTNLFAKAEEWVLQNYHPRNPDGTYNTDVWLHDYVGFDVEFDRYNRARALLLGAPNGQELVYHCPTWRFGDAIRRLLNSPHVMKVGLGVWDDAMRLHAAGVQHLQGFLDLLPLVQIYEKYVNGVANAADDGLMEFAKRYLGIKIKNSRKAGDSGWANVTPLSRRHIRYGCLDAFASLEVFRVLLARLTPAARARFNVIAAEMLRKHRR
ncbi:Exonuclease 3'-5' domain-containing protein 2 [Rhizophlyctis rosea]|uniref:Exonuclease 3'-5' domain-containing protein 2 n=1 Tax=Rhizophlyctis rosea TaxID=64517 RepID=A0AAD5SEJ4_9FUNG|nr:Exonuclease 3'-5' domain-containing protein 2 [Rhizophlyctis rosea]